MTARSPTRHGRDLDGRGRVIGVGPSSARRATERMLERGTFDHVMVVGIAGGLDPALPVGGLIVPRRVRLYPDGPLYHSHPLPSRRAEGNLMTTDGLLSAEETWRAILESGFGAVDMEAAGVAEACERPASTGRSTGASAIAPTRTSSTRRSSR
jgi:uridine phosphorylase